MLRCRGTGPQAQQLDEPEVAAKDLDEIGIGRRQRDQRIRQLDDAAVAAAAVLGGHAQGAETSP